MFRELNVKNTGKKKEVAFKCACQTCISNGEVTGYGTNTEVFCFQQERRVYATKTIGGCPHATPRELAA